MCFKELHKHELDVLFKHFDKKGTGSISKEEFTQGLNESMGLDNKLKFYLHDFLTPLQTITKSLRLKPNDIFDIFSTNKQSIDIENMK